MPTKNEISDIAKKWYQTNWGIFLLIVLFFPVGLYLMWRKTNWDVRIKKGITGLIVVIAIIQIVSSGFSSEHYGEGIKRAQEKAETVRTIPTSTPIPTATPKLAEKMNVVVTSQIVKKVGNKYRYFFDIRNRDAKNFEGNVSIVLYSGEGRDLAGDTFSTKAPIETGLGTLVYFDAFTGPAEIHGVNGITKYKYTVKVDGSEVNNGEGKITSKYEDVGAY